MRSFTRPAALLTALALAAVSASAQRNRITRPVDNNRRVTIARHIHPKARPQDDIGRVSPSLELSQVTLILSQSDNQKADLEQLLSEQQNPATTNYHRWLTPEEYADRFGVSQDDLNTLASWLQQQGLAIAGVARGRNW